MKKSSTQRLAQLKNSQNHAKRMGQRGFSMISVLLGLVVAGILGAIVIEQFNDGQRKARIEAATSQILTMTAEAQKLYGNNNQYGQVTTAIAVQGNIVPARLRIAGTNTAQNKYNGAITFAPATITSANDSLTMTYANVLKDDCQDVVNAVQALMRQVQVAGTDVKPADGVISVATMSTQCDSAARVPLAFTFGRQ
jgi:type II secretory pathway pseudopilin PulG